VPVKNFEGQLIGVISGSVDLEQFSACLKHQQSGSSYAFIVDKTGKVLAHPSADAVKEQRDLTALEPVKKAILGETGVAFYAYENVRKVAGYTFMPTTRWGVVMQVPEEEALAGVQKIKYTALLSAVVAIIFACMLGFLIARAVTKPIKQMAEASEIVAAGDLTHTVSIENQDEMGKLAGSFNLMVSNLRNLVSQVVVNAETVSASAQQLWASSSEASKAVEQIALTAGELAAGAQNQTCEAATTARTMQELATSAKEVAQKAESAAFLAQDVVSSAQVGNTSVHKAVEQMLEIDGAITTTADLVKELGLRSSEIGNIVEVIANIAGQTNLLALNAAIEAARAGEQGRGFAVVADEVRKLAEQAQGAAGQIAEIVNQIQGQTSAAVTAMDNGTRKVEEGVQVAKDAGIAIDSILSKVNQSVSMIESISAAAQQQAASTNEVVKSVNNVAAIAEQSGVGAETTATATEETTASMEEIAASSQALADTAVELQKLVQQFKV
jgi:methyl-accepting chemotaxis protein